MRRRTSVGSWAPGAMAAALAACGGDKLVLGGGGDSGCVPGPYSGVYSCTTGADAAFTSAQSGTVTMVLQGDRGGASLAIAPGAVVSGVQAGDTLQSSVTGTLDCVKNQLVAKVGDVVVLSPAGKVATFYESEPMTADYDPRASPPALVHGFIVAPQLPTTGLTSTCTWSAKLSP